MRRERKRFVLRALLAGMVAFSLAEPSPSSYFSFSHIQAGRSRVHHRIFPFHIQNHFSCSRTKKIEQKKDPPQEPNLVKYSTGCEVEERMAYVKLEGFCFVQKKDYLPIKREID